MGELQSDLRKLLNGEVLPVDGVDIKLKSVFPHGDDRPVVKRTITYIVMAMVFDDRGRMILIQEAKQSCYGQWYPPAGRVEPGENLIDGVRREVLEEGGVEFEPQSVINVEIDKFYWSRVCYIGRASGDKLKTLDQKDSESLQAGWFTPKEIRSGQLKLRYKDFFRSMDIAERYLGVGPDEKHPSYNIGVHPYLHILHRPVIVRVKSPGSIQVLYNTNRSCLPCCKANPQDSLTSTVAAILMQVFNAGFHQLKMKGLLTLEHCGIPAREHDGICITTVLKVPKKLHNVLDSVVNSDYGWVELTDQDFKDQFSKRALSKPEQLLIPIF